MPITLLVSALYVGAFFSQILPTSVGDDLFGMEARGHAAREGNL
jgi:hypothetical protein